MHTSEIWLINGLDIIACLFWTSLIYEWVQGYFVARLALDNAVFYSCMNKKHARHQASHIQDVYIISVQYT